VSITSGIPPVIREIRQEIPDTGTHNTSENTSQEPPQALDGGMTRSFDMNNRCSRCKAVGHMARGCNNQHHSKN